MASLRNPRTTSHMPAACPPGLRMADGGLADLTHRMAGSLRGWITGANNTTRHQEGEDAAPPPTMRAAPAPAPTPPAPAPNPNASAQNPAGIQFQHGGRVQGPGTGTSDSIPAHLSRGEYVLPADTVRHVGVDKLDALRQATHTPVRSLRGGFANGGIPGLDVHEIDPETIHVGPNGSATPQMQAPTNPNVGPGGSAEAQAFRASRAAAPAAEGVAADAAGAAGKAAKAGILNADVGAALRGGAGALRNGVGKVLSSAAAEAALPLTATVSAAKSYNTPTEQYSNRIGSGAPESLGGELAQRGVGVLSDLGDTLTGGLATKFGNFIAGNGFNANNADGTTPNADTGPAAPGQPHGPPGAPPPSLRGNPGAAALAQPDAPTTPASSSDVKRVGNSYSGGVVTGDNITINGKTPGGGFMTVPAASLTGGAGGLRGGADSGAAPAPGGGLTTIGDPAAYARNNLLDPSNIAARNAQTAAESNAFMSGGRGTSINRMNAETARLHANNDNINQQARNQTDLRGQDLTYGATTRGQDVQERGQDVSSGTERYVADQHLRGAMAPIQRQMYIQRLTSQISQAAGGDPVKAAQLAGQYGLPEVADQFQRLATGAQALGTTAAASRDAGQAAYEKQVEGQYTTPDPKTGAPTVDHAAVAEHLQGTQAAISALAAHARASGNAQAAAQLEKQGINALDENDRQQISQGIALKRLTEQNHGVGPTSGTYVESPNPLDYRIVGQATNALGTPVYKLANGSTIPQRAVNYDKGGNLILPNSFGNHRSRNFTAIGQPGGTQ